MRFSIARFMITSLLAAAACTPSPAAEPPSPQLSQSSAATEAAITADNLRYLLTAFAHDSMMGREAGTLGNVKGTDYIAAQLTRIGLEPGGDDGSYFQTLPLVERTVDPNSSLSVAGSQLELGTDYLPFPPGGGFLPFSFGIGGSLEGVEVIYGGQLGDTLNTLSAEQAAGKLVLFSPSLSMGAAAVRAVDRLAAARGIAIASLHLLPQNFRDFLSQPRSMLAGGPKPEGPAGMLVTLEAAAILLGVPLDRAEVGGRGATLTGGFRFIYQPIRHPARNVVAIVRGSDPALRGEYVAIGSHNDHDGLGSSVFDHDSLRAFNRVVRPGGAESRTRQPTAEQQRVINTELTALRLERPARPDSIYNGADDDGSGSMAMLEIAEAFAASTSKPRRSILFVWHTAEEKGLLGARHFTDNPTVPRDAIVANINLDMIGRGSAGDIENGGPAYLQVIGSRRLSTELGDLVEEVNARGRFGFEFDYQYDAAGHPQQFYCRSDHYMYARYGIPIVFFSTGSHMDYHQVTDEAQYIDYEKMARVSRLVFEIATTVANLDHRLVVDKAKPDPTARCRQ